MFCPLTAQSCLDIQHLENTGNQAVVFPQPWPAQQAQPAVRASQASQGFGLFPY